MQLIRLKFKEEKHMSISIEAVTALKKIHHYSC